MLIQHFAKRIFPLRITRRIYASIVLLIVALAIILAVTVSTFYVKLEVMERERELDTVAGLLNAQLQGSFTDILQEYNAVGATRADKLRVLHNNLQPIIRRLSSSYPKVGMAYYSTELDSVVAAGPAFNAAMLRKLPESHPYFEAYQDGKPVFGYRTGSRIWAGKAVAFLAYPIYREGKIVGLIWANMRLDDVYFGVITGIAVIMLVSFLLLLVFVRLTGQIFRRLSDELQDFANAVIRDDPVAESAVLPELQPLLDKIKEHTDQLKIFNAQLQQEVAEREQMQEALYQSKEELERFFNLSSDFLCIVGFDGYFKRINPSFTNILGYDAEEFLASPLVSFVHLDDRAKTFIQIEKIAAGTAVHYYKNRCRCKDGSYRWLEWNAIPAMEEGLIYAVARDVTEQVQMKQEIERLDRLNLVGQMAAGIGHEIRNPMTTVRGFLQMLGNKEDSAKYKEFYDLMVQELDRANAIITEYLSLARNKQVELSFLNLNSIIEAMAPLIESNARVTDTYFQRKLQDVPNLLLDAKEIRQLILNLTRNGFEAMQPGGTLTIRTFMEAGEVVLAVEDEGEGISPEVFGKLGTPFVTTKEQGTGLGLSVCYSIAARHDAKITVETGPQGTIFYVRFKTLEKMMAS